jgi:glyoxylase-like metal-dependent hydrolase (beta-lactamase superfamily II)
MITIPTHRTDRRGAPAEAVRIVTAGGTPIYLLPLETFDNHVNNVYLIDHPDGAVLFDVGTARANGALDLRFEEIRERFGVRTRIADLALAIVSHAHIDHFGNAGRMFAEGVPVAIHPRDARVLSRFAERLVLAARDLGVFMLRAGLDPADTARLTAMYRSGKTLFRDQEPQRRIHEGDVVGPGWRVLDAPGHCPGMICLAVDDVVLTADLLLTRITPVQTPQSITPFTGLDHYLHSLEELARFGEFAVGLGGHEAPILDVRGRIAETRAHHGERLHRILKEFDGPPRTTADVSREMFGAQKGYGVLLALLETGAHVEYLHERGRLRVENLDQAVERHDAPMLYRAVGDHDPDEDLLDEPAA